jgi:hypothetical protein
MMHLQKYGDANNLHLPPCSIQQVYDMLVCVQAPSVPTKLNTVDYLPLPSVIKPVASSPVTTDQDTGLIANMKISPTC